MSSYKIMTDGALNLDPSVIDAHDVYVIPMSVTISDREFLIGSDTEPGDVDTFYELLLSDAAYTTQISLGIYELHFEKFLKVDTDILYLSMSSGISSTYNQSLLAADSMMKKYPTRTVHCLDTRTCAAGGSPIVKRAIANLKAGLSLEENVEDLKRYRDRVVLAGFISRLDHLKRSGRLSGAQALMGSALNIKPVLRMNQGGELVLKNKVRGAKQATKHLIDDIQAELDPKEPVCYITHGDDADLAEQVKAQILSTSDIREVHIDVLSPVISAHLGQGGLAIGYVTKASKSLES